MKLSAGVVLFVGMTGCHSGFSNVRPQDSAAEKVLPPRVDRCQNVTGGDRDHCNQLKSEARKYVSGLSVNDNVCVEGGFGDEAPSGCKARGQVIDGDNDGFVFKIHDPVAGSHWQNYDNKDVWFANEALVDQYLLDRGFH